MWKAEFQDQEVAHLIGLNRIDWFSPMLYKGNKAFPNAI